MNDVAMQTTSMDVEALIQALQAIIGTILVVTAIIYILTVIANWKIFSKAGEKGWKALIPVYNNYILYKIAWEPKFFWIRMGLGIVSVIILRMGNSGIFLNLVSMVCSIAIIYFMAKLCGKLAKSFGKGTGFAVGLFLFPTIFQLILGLGSSEYTKVEE